MHGCHVPHCCIVGEGGTHAGSVSHWIGTPTDVGYNQEPVKRIVDFDVAYLNAVLVVM